MSGFASVAFARYVNLVGSAVGGFFVPPIGVIDGSVLTAVGLLLLFATVEKIPEAVKAGRNLKIQKGDFEINVGSEDQE